MDAYFKTHVAEKIRRLTFDFRINRNQLVLGDNGIRIVIKDAQCNPLKGLRVFLNYCMPPHAGHVSFELYHSS